MSEPNSVGKNKVKLSVGKLLNVGGGGGGSSNNPGGDIGRLLPPSIVTPVLRDVGKLAASVAAVNTNGKGGSGSATGNPRNKCSLAPGHSLMDWIRLGNSGKDLTGVGALAGKITVSPDEMIQHNKREDAWIAIRGNVYNVTEYLAFHPGGVEELMRGVGLPDATALFDEVHPWVNYDKMLTKCYVGRLGAGSVSSITETGNVRFESPKLSDTPEPPKIPIIPVMRTYNIAVNDDRQVRFDWIQKHDILVLYFYTGAYSNPYFDIRRPFENKWTFVITFVESVFTFKYSPQENLRWPPRFKVFYETGKIEVGFEKEVKKTWPTCGTLEQSKRKIIPQEWKRKYIIKEHVMINKSTFMMSLQKTDMSLCNTPLGYHIMLYNDVNDAREYTPVPHLFIKPDNQDPREAFNSPFVTLLIRRYSDGRLSNFLYNKQVGDTVLGSEPMGTFDLQLISDKQHFLFISGGVGITPFLSIIQFLLEKKLKPVQLIMLVNFNQTSQYQFLHKKFEILTEDPRFTFVPVLTQPGPSDYSNISGYMSEELMRTFLQKGFPGVHVQDIFFLCCGPSSLNNGCFEQLMHLGVDIDNTYFFSATSVQQNETAGISVSDISVKQ